MNATAVLRSFLAPLFLFGVVLFTLVVQGTTIGRVVSWAGGGSTPGDTDRAAPADGSAPAEQPAAT